MTTRPDAAAAVEFALVLPLLMLLVLGAVDWGYYFWVEQVVTNAAREGARAGTLQEADEAATAEAQLTAQTYLRGAGLTPEKAGITVELKSPGPTVQSVRVRVTYPTGITRYAPLAVPQSALADAEMRR